MKVIPIDGRSVPDPARGYACLPEAGRNVAMSSYWMKRIAAGDVKVEEQAETAPPETETEQPEIETPPPEPDTAAPPVTTKRSRKS